MSPQSRLPTPNTNTNKLYFFYGYRKPSQNRPTVRGGLFSNRKTLNPNQFETLNSKRQPSSTSSTTFDLQKWDPNSPQTLTSSPIKPSSENFFSVARTLSPIARYICDSFRKYKNWGPAVIADLNKLRRVTPNLVAEVLKVQTDPKISSKFFHWAGYVQNDAMHYAIISAMCKHGIMEEAGMTQGTPDNWLMHHSGMKRNSGDVSHHNTLSALSSPATRFPGIRNLVERSPCISGNKNHPGAEDLRDKLAVSED